LKVPEGVTAQEPAADPIQEAGRLGGPLASGAISALSAASNHLNRPPDMEGLLPGEARVPEGATAQEAPAQMEGMTSGQTPEQPGILQRALTGVGQSLENNFVAPVKAAFSAPKDHKEALALQYGGIEGLEAYRAARQVAGSVEQMIKSPKENYEQTTSDFQRAVNDYKSKGLFSRESLASAGALAADQMSSIPGGEIIGSRAHELAEGIRPGGDLVTPLAKDLTDLATLWASEKAPEIAQGVKKVANLPKDFWAGRLTAEEAAAVPANAKFQPATNLTPQEVLTHAQQEGVDLTPGQAIKSKFRQAEQGLGERAFLGGQGLEDQI
jgi:hypothetical protein